MPESGDKSRSSILELFGSALSEIHRIKNSEIVDVNDDLRRSAPGAFVETPRGMLHYELAGPEDGPLVVLLSGATLPMWIWDKVVAPLGDAGMRVLRFNYFGRGYSDCPPDAQDPSFFNRQIDELLAALELKRPVHFVSVAFGGLISLLYAEQKPQEVASLTLICPDGLGTNVSAALNLMKTPGIGDYLFDLVGNDLLLQRMPAYSPNRELVAELSRRIEECFPVKGYKRSVLSSIREMPIHSAEHAFQAAAANRIPTMVLWGDKDGTTPIELLGSIKAAMPHADYRVLSSGHLPQYEHPQLFLDHAVPFLKGHSQKASVAQPSVSLARVVN